MTEKDMIISNLEKEINHLKNSIKNLTSLIHHIKSEDWHRIKWEYIDAQKENTFYFGMVGKIDRPYFYIRQQIGDIWNEVILSKEQMEELQNESLER